MTMNREGAEEKIEGRRSVLTPNDGLAV